MTFIPPNDPLPTLDAAGVAAFLRTTEERFLRQVRRLQREHGFPRHLPGLARKWSRSQVLGWIENGGQFERPPLQSDADVADMVKAAERGLLNRYGARQ